MKLMLISGHERCCLIAEASFVMKRIRVMSSCVALALALTVPLIASANEFSLISLPFLLKRAAFVGTVKITSITPLRRNSNDVKACGYRFQAKALDVLKGSTRKLSFIAESRKRFIRGNTRYFLIAYHGNGQSKKGICDIPSSGYYILPFQPMFFPLYEEGKRKQHTWMLVERKGGVTWRIAGSQIKTNIAFRRKPLEMDGRVYTAWSWTDFRKVVYAELKGEKGSE